MLRLNPLEVIQRFRKPGGDEFADFCNKIIRASCWAAGVPQSVVSTSSRTDAKDNGVDTGVAASLPNDRSGYFDAPSAWQFKATDASSITRPDLEKEVNKPRAKQRIAEGYGYRLCICDHLTPDKKQALLHELTEAVQTITQKPAPPMILSVDDLVELANSFPALLLEYRPRVDAICLLFDPWSKSLISVTPVFVPASGFDSTKTTVLEHVDFGKQVRSPVLTLYGTPGAGKTRAAFECLREIPVATSLVLYTSSEDEVLELANMLANEQRAYAIVVVDECSISMREKLVRTLMGSRGRIRCVCIDNDADRSRTESPELVIQKLGSSDLEKVLRANFSEIPYDRIRAYAQYCDGSVRLAADMCAHYDPEVAQARTMGPVLARIDDYYRVRLDDYEHREAVDAIALLKRVRYKGESPTELELICELTGIADKTKLERSLSQIKDTPGWVEKGELYYRVTPDIIAMIAFGSAWARWARGNENAFLAKVPAAIQESFLQRVSESGSPEVRQTVQTFFRRFADDFTPRDLAHIRMVNRFVNLIETDSHSYLPSLRRVIEAATQDDLIGAPKWTGGSWGPRRQLVWTMENFVLFPEHFADCEAILFRLAQNECEPEIGNNATKTWQHLFRLQMSGTAVPLADRLALLRSRLRQATDGTAELLSGALGEILDTMGVRMLGPPVVGGRVPPADWYPCSAEEMKESVRAGLLLLDETARHPTKAIAKAAKDSLLQDLVALTRRGWLSELRPFVAHSLLDESEKASLASRLMHVLTWGKDTENNLLSEQYATMLRDWIAELEPKSFHARLVGTVGGSSMEHYGREQEWEQELDRLSAELLRDSALFDSEIAWLCSSEAKSAFELGSRLGTMDRSAPLIDKIVAKSTRDQIGLLRGYVAGLLYGAKADSHIVNSRLDRIEVQDPIFSFQVALAGGSHVKVFERATRLIREGHLPVQGLRNFTFWVGDVRVTNDQVIEAISLLTPLAPADPFASDMIMEFLGARLHVGQFAELLLANSDVIWKAISIAAGNPGKDAFWLAQVLKAAAPTNQLLAIQLASKALVGDNFAFKDEAEKLLSSWVSRYPEEVMDSVGAMILDEERGWRFFTGKFGIFHAIPEDVVIRWLDAVGVKGAQRIARHLPVPFLDPAGEPKVPKLTEYVLSHFEDDRLTFSEFCAGVHSFQVYRGDIASQREREAQSVRPFFNHRLKRIREWAHYEHDSGLEEAKYHREREDEMNA